MPVERDPIDGWQHADGSISHDGEFYGKSVSDLVKDAARFVPDKRVFTHTDGLDHRLFDGERLRPEVRVDVIARFTAFCLRHGYQSWLSWAKLVFFGSEASEWTSLTLEGNGDFDLSVGLEYETFRQLHPGFVEMGDTEIAQLFTGQLHTELNDPQHFFLVEGLGRIGPFDQTWFANELGWDIRRIKPYAAYDVTDDEWVVKPPHLPHWSISELPKAVQQVLRAADSYARHVLRLPEPERTQQGAALYEAWHSDRTRAFSDRGEGWYDIANLREKWGDQRGWWAELVACKHRANEGLDRAPEGWSNVPTGYLASKTPWREYDQLPELARRSVHQYMGENDEFTDDELEKHKRNFRYHLHQVPVEHIKQRLMQDEDVKGDFGNFEDYHRWYQQDLNHPGSDRSPTTDSHHERWPLIDSGGVSIADGHHRFHHYLDQGDTHVPVVAFRPKNAMRIAAGNERPCSACGGTGEQGTGHECYQCDGSGLAMDQDSSIDNANPENGLLVGRDDARGIRPVTAVTEIPAARESYSSRTARSYRPGDHHHLCTEGTPAHKTAVAGEPGELQPHQAAVYHAQRAMTESGKDLYHYLNHTQVQDMGRTVLSEQGHPHGDKLLINHANPGRSYVKYDPDSHWPRIGLAPNHLHSHAVFHELAHVLTNSDHESTSDEEAHGPAFVDTYRHLLDSYSSTGARQVFDEHYHSPGHTATRKDPHHGDGPFFHGTNADLKPGDQLLPGDQVGEKSHGHYSDGSKVWISNDPGRASAYGHRTYEVQPHSRPRSPYANHDEHHTTGATVLREVDHRGQSLPAREAVRRMLPHAEIAKLRFIDHPGKSIDAVRVQLKRNTPEYYQALHEHIAEHGVQNPVLLRRRPRGRLDHVMDGTHRAVIAHELGQDIPVGDYDDPKDYDAAYAGPGAREWANKRWELGARRARKLPKTQKCEYCDSQATKRLLWAEGMGYIPVCDSHEDKGRHRIEVTNKDEVVSVQKIGAYQHRPAGPPRPEDYYEGGQPAHNLDFNRSGSSCYDSSPTRRVRSLFDHPDTKVIRTLMQAKGNPEHPVTMYRALPHEHTDAGFRTGDWVTLSKAYAQSHARGNGGMPVIKATVPAGHLWTDGDYNEWGYHGPAVPGEIHTRGRQAGRTASAVTDALDEVGCKEHPNVDHYQSGGMGHLDGDPEHGVVGFMPTHVIKRYREHSGDWHGEHSQETVDGIRSDIREGKGITTPLMIEYDHKLKWGYLGEGNHRLRAAEEEGQRTVPVRVVRSSGVESKKKRGIGAPMHLNTTFAAHDPDYVPSDIHPYHFLAPDRHEAKLARSLGSPDHEQGYEHGLLGDYNNHRILTRRQESGRPLDPEDHEYLAGHTEGVHEAQSREHHRAETGDFKCPQCAGTGMGVWRGGSSCNECHGSGSIDSEAAHRTDTLYHVTDNPHFSPSAHHIPEDNAIAVSERARPGLFAAHKQDVEHWTRGQGYVRPYVAEIQVPHHAHEPGRWGGERFIPAEHLDKVKVRRIIPLSAHGTDYRGPDAREMTPAQHAQHKQRALNELRDEHGFGPEDIDHLRKTWASQQAAGQLWITPQLVMGTAAGLNHARAVNSTAEALAAVRDGLTAVLPAGAWFVVRATLIHLGMGLFDVNQRLRQLGAPVGVTGQLVA